jgi:ribosomal protein S27E
MTVSFNLSGNIQTVFSKPADTNYATIYTVPDGVRRVVLVGMNIACTGASNVTVAYNNGSTDVLLIDALVMSANTFRTDDFGNIALQEGWLVKVKTSNADDATFTLTIAEEYRL